jgi:DNA-binding CsgD family transcriptional regulator
VLLDAGDGPELPRMLNILRARSFETLARTALALGRPDEAEHWAGRAEAQTAGEELPLDRVAANRARAAVRLALGDAVTAAALADEATQVAMAMGAVIDAGRAQLLAARALVESDDRKRAVGILETAEEVFATAGAECYRRQAVAELRRLGRRRPPRTSEGTVGVASLTAREREIAALVVEGKTNREVATSCYISEKTVETHVAHIFAKLGVSTRTALKASLGDELRSLSS